MNRADSGRGRSSPSLAFGVDRSLLRPSPIPSRPRERQPRRRRPRASSPGKTNRCRRRPSRPPSAEEGRAEEGEPKPAAASPRPRRRRSRRCTLETDVPGASVFIDRQFVGNTPLSLDKLEPGTKRVQITATGFDSVQKTIELNPGPNAITIRVKEVSLSARAGVVHKHGMGSCEGS